jgi:hypothetical protein
MNTKTKKQLRVEQTTIGSPSVGAGGHIDLALGTFDRPGPNPHKTQGIVPTEMVSTQLATPRPPIEDEDYVPTSQYELSVSASEIAKLIPVDQIAKFYDKLKELADDFVERQEITTLDKKEDMIESKKKILKMIREALDDLDDDALSAMGSGDSAAYADIVAASPEEFADVKPGRQYAVARSAEMTGRGKLRALMDVAPEDERLQKVAKDEYIDLFKEIVGDDASAEDIADLEKLTPESLYDMSDSYKFFFKAAFVFPVADAYQKAYSKIDRDLSKDVQGKLRDMGVPSSTIVTTAAQVLGFSQRDPQKIKQKYIEAGKVGEIKPEEVDMAYKKLMAKYPSLESKAKSDKVAMRNQATRDFVKSSLDNYSKMSLPQKMNLMKQAFAKMG